MHRDTQRGGKISSVRRHRRRRGVLRPADKVINILPSSIIQRAAFYVCARRARGVRVEPGWWVRWVAARPPAGRPAVPIVGWRYAGSGCANLPPGRISGARSAQHHLPLGEHMHSRARDSTTDTPRALSRSRRPTRGLRQVSTPQNSFTRTRAHGFFK
jgi:hypothetical protein